MDFLTKNRIISLIVIIFFLLNAATLGVMWFTLFKKESHRLPPPPPDVFKGLMHVLNLNQQQREKLQFLQNAHRSFMLKNDLEIRMNKENLLNEVFSDSLRSDSIDAWVSNISRLQAEKEKFIFTHLREIRDLCDEKQRKIFQEFIEQSAPPPPDSPPPMK